MHAQQLLGYEWPTYIAKSRYIRGEAEILSPGGSGGLHVGGSLDCQARVGHVLLLLIGQK